MNATFARGASATAIVLLTLTGATACNSDPAPVPTPASQTSSPGEATSPTPRSEASSGEATPSGTDEAGSDLPSSLFEAGGTTFADFMEENPRSDYFDESKETILQEELATGEAQITLTTQEDAEYRVMLFCPSDAIGKTDIYVSSTPEGERDWKAGSEGLCGDWSAGLPPITDGGPMTITATVDNDRPFRMVIAASSD